MPTTYNLHGKYFISAQCFRSFSLWLTDSKAQMSQQKSMTEKNCSLMTSGEQRAGEEPERKRPQTSCRPPVHTPSFTQKCGYQSPRHASRQPTWWTGWIPQHIRQTQRGKNHSESTGESWQNDWGRVSHSKPGRSIYHEQRRHIKVSYIWAEPHGMKSSQIWGDLILELSRQNKP